MLHSPQPSKCFASIAVNSISPFAKQICTPVTRAIPNLELPSIPMRVLPPLLRIPPARAPILRYGVAVLSTTLALIPTLLLAT